MSGYWTSRSRSWLKKDVLIVLKCCLGQWRKDAESTSVKFPVTSLITSLLLLALRQRRIVLDEAPPPVRRSKRKAATIIGNTTLKHDA